MSQVSKFEGLREEQHREYDLLEALARLNGCSPRGAEELVVARRDRETNVFRQAARREEVVGRAVA